MYDDSGVSVCSVYVRGLDVYVCICGHVYAYVLCMTGLPWRRARVSASQCGPDTSWKNRTPQSPAVHRDKG